MNQDWIQLSIQGVFAHDDDKGTHYFVLLRSADKQKLPIWIGQYEAMTISTYFSDEPPARPLTCNLTADLITGLGATMQGAYISELRNETFYATIRIRTGIKTKAFDARPSDAIALSLLFKCPLYVTKAILDECTRAQKLHELKTMSKQSSDLLNDKQTGNQPDDPEAQG